jgi:outer membrane protein assembly factor BamB
MSGQHRLAPSPELRKHWRVIRALLVALIAGVGLGSWWLMTAAGNPAKPPAKAGGVASHWPKLAKAATSVPQPGAPTSASGPNALTASGAGWLAPGSDPSVLPGPLLIADGGGNRVLIIDPNGRNMWQFPRPGDLAAGQTFKSPEVAWFSPDGKQVLTASEDHSVLSVIDIATHKIVYTYGKADAPGSGPNQLNGPDGALMLPSRDLLVPDAANCRIIMIPAGGHATSGQLGQTGTCVHNPPQTFGDPSGLFPMANGNFVVTEGNGHWVSEMTVAGKIAWSVQVPNVSFIYGTSEVAPDQYLTVDQDLPGQVLTFDQTGRVLWRYAPTGDASLNKPSMAIALPNGDILVGDRGNHRLMVVDPRTNFIMWQYGHTKVAGSGIGFLNGPTGMDLYPPYSMTARKAVGL